MHPPPPKPGFHGMKRVACRGLLWEPGTNGRSLVSLLAVMRTGEQIESAVDEFAGCGPENEGNECATARVL
jgi:hypothetical protein